MPEADIGPAIGRGDVAGALRDTLKTYLPFYLAQMDLRAGLPAGTTEVPGNYRTATSRQRWAEEAPPTLLVVCPGTVGEPELHGGDRGSYSAIWGASVGVTVGGADQDDVDAIADRYLKAVRLVVAQQGTLGGLADVSWFKGEQADVLPPSRTLLATETLVHVRVSRIVDTRGPLPRGAPANPTDPAAPPYPTPVGHRVRISARLPTTDDS